MKKTIPFLLLIILFAVATWYSFIKEPDPIHELPPPLLPSSMPAQEQQAGSEDEGIAVYPDPVEIQAPLPPLNESDPGIIQALAEITEADSLAEYLVKSQVVSRLMATIDSLTSRQVPAQINPVKPADGVFVVDTEGEKIIMSAENFARYDGYVALVQNVNPDALVAFYQLYSPLFQEAWEGNGGEGSFNDRLFVVIDQLLETPDIPGPIYLTKPEAVYLFEDPELEAMTAGQKILVRMGSTNAAVVKEKLLEVSTKLSP